MQKTLLVSIVAVSTPNKVYANILICNQTRNR